MTYSILVRDDRTGLMGVACQSQAFAVGSSVPWALPGYGAIATQSMGEPMYGELGLDGLRAGLTASEALTALRSVDPRPERRQVAMVDGYANFAVYTGDACVEAAEDELGDGCVALANMVASPSVWPAMVATWESTAGPVADRLLAALHAAEAEEVTSVVADPPPSWWCEPNAPAARGATASSTCASMTTTIRSASSNGSSPGAAATTAPWKRSTAP